MVLVDKWPSDVAIHASRLGGNYSVMEDINGNFMRGQLAALPTEGDPALALWFARFAKACVVGLAGIDGPVLGRLAQRQTVSHYQRSSIEGVLVALDALLASPTYEELAAAAVIRQTQELKVYRWEAWNDTRQAIAMSADNGKPAVDNLGRLRDRLRRTGRRNDNRIASRPLLVKGLEYDHVIIADLSKLRDPYNLYVALSRARKNGDCSWGPSRIRLQTGA